MIADARTVSVTRTRTHRTCIETDIQKQYLRLTVDGYSIPVLLLSLVRRLTQNKAQMV
jgi:hypothetical protein